MAEDFPALFSRVVRPNRGQEVVDEFSLIPELGGHTPEVDEVVHEGIPRHLAHQGRQPSPDTHLRAIVDVHAPSAAVLGESAPPHQTVKPREKPRGRTDKWGELTRPFSDDR